MTVIVVNAVALGLALALNAKIKFKTALRGVFFIPMVISGIVIAYVFSYLFSTSLPTIAQSIGFGPLQESILVNENYAWVAIVLVTAWQAVPGAMIIYLAGLLADPRGGVRGRLDRRRQGLAAFRSITFPLMLGYVVINTILGFKGFLAPTTSSWA